MSRLEIDYKETEYAIRAYVRERYKIVDIDNVFVGYSGTAIHYKEKTAEAVHGNDNEPKDSKDV